MNKSDVDSAVSAAHSQIVEYLAGASKGGEVSTKKVATVVDNAFGELRQKLDAAAGLPPQR